jgi:MFS transporter, DHA3 family, macrolide efflux protein
MEQNLKQPGIRAFILIWFGQLISLTGSGLTGFALGVWVYLSTGSVTQFALISVSTTLPAILFSPIAGALVDRWDRRIAMIVSDTGAGVCTLVIALLLVGDRLEIWHIYILIGISSTFSAFQWPAYTAATTLLVPKEHFGRASGLVQLAEAAAQIVAPMLAGALLGLIQVQGIILIDFATFLFALGTLLVVRIPRPARTEEGAAGKGSLLKEAAYGWGYIKARRGLLGLLLFFATTNFYFGIASVLFTPLVLSFTTPAVLGVLMSIVGLGMLTGSLTMSAWGGPKKRINAIIGFSMLQGLTMYLAGAPPQVTLIAPAVFVIFFSNPIINGCSQAIWMSKTPPDVQGRVFAVRRMIAWSTMPLSYLIAGPLADRIFEPLMAQGGLLASSIGQIIGVGPGRGVGLIYILLSTLVLLAALVVSLYPPLRNVERDLPDVVGETALAVGSMT